MPKQLMFDHEARLKMRDGVAKLARAVKVTMGPSGRNVILDKSFGKPQATKDGVSVSKEVELPDVFENMGAKLVNEVATKTNSVAGDGTTTATVLAEAIFGAGLRAVSSGAEAGAVKRGIERATAAVVAELKKQSREVAGREDVYKVAYIASREESVAKVIADAFEHVGKDGVVTIEEGRGIATELKIVDGFQFDKGYISPYFVTHPDRMVAELEDCLVLLCEKKIASLRDFLPILEGVVRFGKPLLVVAEDVEGEALAALVVNKLRGILKVVAVKAPGFGDRRKALLEDMAVLTGATLIADDVGITLDKATTEMLGRCRKVVVEKDATTIVEGAGRKESIEARKAQVKELVKQSTSDYDKGKLKERLAKLMGAIAEIDVGGTTEADMKERKARVDDAMHAGRAALAEGVVPGGGVAYVRALPALDTIDAKGDERYGIDIVRRAITTPLRQIADNAGFDGASVLEDVREKDGAYGFDARTGKFSSMWEAGVIDPTKVARVALENASSVAALMLTTTALVAERKEDAAVLAGAIG